MEALYEIDFDRVFYNLIVLAIAFVVSLPVAWDREREARSLGLRTFPLVAMASAGYVLVARSILGDGSPEMARILQGLMTGIGFLGGGAIVKRGADVQGTATAASLWCTAAVGAAVALTRFEIAVPLVLVNFTTLRWLNRVKAVMKKEDEDRDPRADTKDAVQDQRSSSS